MSGRPPKPTRLKILTGQHKKNPKRFKEADKEPQPERDIGDPPKRFALECICYLTDSLRRDEAAATDGKALDSLLVQFGMTPSARARVHISTPKRFQQNQSVCYSWFKK